MALSATIEAARAGEGFAVVASEVENLATRTAKTTDEISQRVGEMQGLSKDAVSAIEGAGGAIEDVRSIANVVTAAVQEQNAATSEIARSAQEAWPVSVLLPAASARATAAAARPSRSWASWRPRQAG